MLEIPELEGLDSRENLVRIPPELDVPLTARVRRIIDTAAFRRLARISQLGLVSLVYPAAHHTRFEHSLGVYRLTLLLLKRLSHLPRFTEMVSVADAELLIASALLHDIGHWPFCHPLEDIRLPGLPKHEFAAQRFLEGELSEILLSDWHVEPEDVLAILNKTEAAKADPVKRLLSSILSGPIDVDKMDYLFRDSLHAGVPYGRHFDQSRLIASVCLNEAGDGLAISEKGKTAAELMVFARYVMFNEVYWNHGVRTATAMLQRAFYIVHDRIDTEKLLLCTEHEAIELLKTASRKTAAEPLVDGLFGPTRRLYKRIAQFSVMEQPEIYRKLAARPYGWLCEVAKKIHEEIISDNNSLLLIDAPPVEKEVEFRIDVFSSKENKYRPLESVSPVVRTLAREQFDEFVKRVRIFGPDELATSSNSLKEHIERWIERNL